MAFHRTHTLICHAKTTPSMIVLKPTCGDELSTCIDVGVTLKGLNTDEEWVPITDTPTTEQYAMQFLQSLDL